SPTTAEPPGHTLREHPHGGYFHVATRWRLSTGSHGGTTVYHDDASSLPPAYRRPIHTDTWRHQMPAYTTRHPTDAPPDNTPSESTALETRDHPHTAAALVQQGARIVRDYAALHDRETAVLKQLADVIVRLRACYQNNDGRPDLRGTSAGYRDAVQAIYYKANI